MPDQDLEPVVQEDAPLGERLVRLSPWWAISAFLHLVLVIVSMYIIALLPREGPAGVIMVQPPRQPPVEPVKPPVKEFAQEKLDLPNPVEKPLQFKAPEDTVAEAPNDQDFAKVMGDTTDALTEKPFKGVSASDAIGAGGGGAGKFGGRVGGHKLRAANGGGGGKETEDAVLNALRWLARHQSPDGSWEAQRHVGRCGRVAAFPRVCTPPNPGAETFQVGLTGLSLLAFLGAGYTHLSRERYDGICFGDVVKKGVQFLMAVKDPSGRVTPDDVPKYMYNHLIAAFALCEAYGLTGSQMIRNAAQKAVDYTIQAQNPGWAWRYSFRSGDSDSSVTGWAAQVLKSAELAELAVPADVVRGLQRGSTGRRKGATSGRGTSAPRLERL